MGFQINNTEVLGSSGITNNANSFKTIQGTSVLGTGNITDSGSAVMNYNVVGSYTAAAYSHGGLYQSSVAASTLRSYYRSSYDGYSWVVMYVFAATYASSAYLGLSGTWMHKSPYLSSSNHLSAPNDVSSAAYISSLWQRIA